MNSGDHEGNTGVSHEFDKAQGAQLSDTRNTRRVAEGMREINAEDVLPPCRVARPIVRCSCVEVKTQQ
jgi:hypothetical protein